MDAVSVHPYTSQNPESIVGAYNTIRGLMRTYGGKTVPIVNSESGYATGSGGGPPSYPPIVATAQLQGDYLARSFLFNLSQGIPLSSWFDFRDANSDPNNTNYEDHFGTVDLDYVPKPAYYELQLLTHSLKGETFTTRLTTGIPSSDWLLVFTSPGGQQSLAAWTTGDAHTDTVSGWGTLHLTSTPFYVNPTLLPGDANLDGTVNVQDLAILAANYRKNVTGGWTSRRLQQRRRGGRPGPGPFGDQLPAQSGVERRPGLRWIRRRSDPGVVAGRSDRGARTGCACAVGWRLVGAVGLCLAEMEMICVPKQSEI